MQETEFIKFSPENVYLRASFASFPRAQSASLWPSPWTPFRVYCRSATAVANGLTLVELGGGQHSLSYNSFSFGLNFDQSLGGTSWPICPMLLGMLIPRPGKYFVDRPLNVLLLDWVLLTVAKSLWTICLTKLLWFRIWFPLVAFSHIWSYTITIIDLIGLCIWSMVSSRLIIINFIWGSVIYLVA